ncbi:hypothetical protein HDU96_004694 [Phlyctochytrium bullatum]|nr:hypothetical protein HDU96_004694 [Phlyctochytrium bullatum]
MEHASDSNLQLDFTDDCAAVDFSPPGFDFASITRLPVLEASDLAKLRSKDAETELPASKVSASSLSADCEIKTGILCSPESKTAKHTCIESTDSSVLETKRDPADSPLLDTKIDGTKRNLSSALELNKRGQNPICDPRKTNYCRFIFVPPTEDKSPSSLNANNSAERSVDESPATETIVKASTCVPRREIKAPRKPREKCTGLVIKPGQTGPEFTFTAAGRMRRVEPPPVTHIPLEIRTIRKPRTARTKAKESNVVVTSEKPELVGTVEVKTEVNVQLEGFTEIEKSSVESLKAEVEGYKSIEKSSLGDEVAANEDIELISEMSESFESTTTHVEHLEKQFDASTVSAADVTLEMEFGKLSSEEDASSEINTSAALSEQSDVLHAGSCELTILDSKLTKTREELLVSLISRFGCAIESAIFIFRQLLSGVKGTLERLRSLLIGVLRVFLEAFRLKERELEQTFSDVISIIFGPARQ